MARPKTSRSSEWYSISVDTLRNLGKLLLLVTVVALAAAGYYLWNRFSLQHRAETVIDEVVVLLRRTESHRNLSSFVDQFSEAHDSFQAARRAYQAGDYSEAFESATRSRNLLRSILDGLGEGVSPGEARIISVRGRVEYRLGDRSQWREARTRVSLRSGDWVRTHSNGSVEIMFLDGTLYSVRPNTLVAVSQIGNLGGAPAEKAITMEYGLVDLNTAEHGSRITTPGAEARVQERSQASVSYDQASETGHFAAFQGGMEVESASGITRQIGELEEVTQVGSTLDEPRPLLVSPSIIEPADGLEVDLSRLDRLVMRWQPVAGAAGYALQVSRNHLFVDNIVDVERRDRTRATLDLRGEGNFFWHVASVRRDGLRGPWSPTRRFRVTSGGGDSSDLEPPFLELDEIENYGNLFIISGRTEPGCTLKVNDELVPTDADGSFSKTIQLAEEGWASVVVRAQDASGNETVSRKRVFVESL